VQSRGIGRRDFLRLGGALAAWPAAGRAQAIRPARRIGVLMNYAQGDPEGEARAAALRHSLQKLGWIEGENIRTEFRWAQGRDDRVNVYAAELSGLPLDAIVANSTPATAALRRATRTVPIVFIQVSDPVGTGFVANLAQPDGNLTGFADFEPSIIGKWIELLRELMPSVTKAGVLLNPQAGNQMAFWRAAEVAARAANLQVTALGVHDRAGIERVIADSAAETHIGLIVVPTPVNNTLRDTIIKITTQYRIPTVYPYYYYAADGGLLAYGIDQVEQWAEAAGYVDRILRGGKVSELPVQSPTKFKLWINLRTAKALGVDISPTLLARADEVFE